MAKWGREEEGGGRRKESKSFLESKWSRGHLHKTVDVPLTWALDGIANVSMFLKLSVSELNFNVLLKTLHTHAVLGLTVEHHHQITVGKMNNVLSMLHMVLQVDHP